MNKSRRDNIQEVVGQLEDLKSTLEGLQGEAVNGLEDIITSLGELAEG